MSILSLRKLKFEILACLAGGERQHKVNMIGRAYPGGGELERRLDVKFDDATRALAARAFDELRTADMIRSDYSGLTDPESWVQITERGRMALRRKALDDLDNVLFEIDPHLVEIRDGAWSAVAAGTADSLRQAAHSGRELFDQTLRKATADLAPEGDDEKVKRRARMRHIMQKGRGRVSDSDLAVADKATDLALAVHKSLLARVHADSAPEKQDVVDMLNALEIAMRKLFLQSEGAVEERRA